MKQQIFGYTPAHKDGYDYVKFCSAHRDSEGGVTIHIRSEHGVINDITLPRTEVAKFAASLNTRPTITEAEAVDIAAKLSVEKFPSKESPLVLDIVNETIRALAEAGVLNLKGE